MRKISPLIGAALLLSACVSTFSVSSLDDGMPAHNPGIVHQTAILDVPGFDRLHWGMTEIEIKTFYPDFANAYEGRFNSAGMIDPMAYRMLRLQHHRVGECDYEVTLRYFHTAGSMTFDRLKYFDMRFTGGDLEACHEVAKAELLRREGPHPKLEIARSNAPADRGRVTGMWWEGPATVIQLYDNNIGRQPSFDIVYKDASDVVMEPIVTYRRR